MLPLIKALHTAKKNGWVKPKLTTTIFTAELSFNDGPFPNNVYVSYTNSGIYKGRVECANPDTFLFVGKPPIDTKLFCKEIKKLFVNIEALCASYGKNHHKCPCCGNKFINTLQGISGMHDTCRTSFGWGTIEHPEFSVLPDSQIITNKNQTGNPDEGLVFLFREEDK